MNEQEKRERRAQEEGEDERDVFLYLRGAQQGMG